MILKGDWLELDDGYSGDAASEERGMPLCLDEGQLHLVRQSARRCCSCL